MKDNIKKKAVPRNGPIIANLVQISVESVVETTLTMVEANTQTAAFMQTNRNSVALRLNRRRKQTKKPIITIVAAKEKLTTAAGQIAE